MRSPYYINVNGCYGQGPYAQPDYETLQSLLDSMDRIGVWQTVVYHSNARDLHPLYGNRFLLEDIEKTPGASERVIPALVANPSMLVGNGEMEHLVQCLEKQLAGCVALFPVINRYRLLEIRPVLDRIRGYRPLILIDVTEMTSEDMEDLAAIAKDYPELYFLVRQIMWWQFSRVFNLLGRTRNIAADISWLHTRDSIRILRDQAGADRLVFGAGFRAHGGASKAALSWADIPQDEKDRIAADNLISMLPDGIRERAAAGRRTIPHAIGNRFFDAFLDEKGLRDVLVIDAHTHIGPFTRSWFLRDNTLEGQLKQLYRDSERFGIDLFLSQPETALFGQAIEGNRMLERALADSGRLCGRDLTERFRGNLFFNAIYSELYTEEVLDSFFAGKYYCGFKIVPEYLEVDIADPRLIPCFTYADRHHLHVLVHTWEGKSGTALQTAEVAAKYPNATFVLGHSGGGSEGRHQCERIAQDPKYANCVFEFCGSFTTPVRWEDSLKKIDWHRVVYGTDTIVHDIAWELGRLLSLDIPEKQIEDILGRNMLRVLQKNLVLQKEGFLEKTGKVI